MYNRDLVALAGLRRRALSLRLVGRGSLAAVLPLMSLWSVVGVAIGAVGAAMMKPPVPCQGDIKERSAKAGYYSRTPRPVASKELTYQDHARRNLRTVRPGTKG